MLVFKIIGIGNTCEKEKMFSSKSENVLKKIAAESKINKHRVARFSIDLNNET